MLKNEEIKKIEDFVAEKPRSVHEIAEFLGISWRTADRYLEQIKLELGTIETRVFREGTRGALKIVFLTGVEKVSHSAFQQDLEKQILEAKSKEDFSAFDIYQHVPDKNKKVKIEKSPTSGMDLEEFVTQLEQAQKQVLLFSGNLSLINLKDKKYEMFKVFEGLVKRKVSVKVLCRVDLAGKENVEKLLSLNFKYGKEVVEIKHCEHPIRASVIDSHIFRIQEINEPTGKINELAKKLFVFYTIKDKDWIAWISRIFWKRFSSAIGANKRLEELNKLNFRD
ncbi:hypothetical protein KA107_02325 [Candidatus Pacearchaeota archaeon]|nr:hypothetical protein [Candidatus Pacearchaeota archaeon]